MTLPIDIRGSGTSWAVFVGGRQVDAVTNTYNKACIKAATIERRLQRVDGQTASR